MSTLITIIGIYYAPSIGNDWFHTNAMTNSTFFFKLLSIILLFYIFRIFPKKNLYEYLTKYGKDSMIIYLVHLPLTSFFKIILIKIGIPNYFVFLLLVISISWFTSVFICYLANRFNIIRAVFYPYKYILKYQVQFKNNYLNHKFK